MTLRSTLARAGVAAALLLAAPAPAAALPSTITVACVGGGIGCSQVDFFITLLSGAPADVNSFTITLTEPSWRFGPSAAAYVESEDAFGFNLADPTVNAAQTVLTGEFILFPATLDPTLRVRTELSIFDPAINTLGATVVALDAAGAEIASGVITATPNAVVPEPTTVVLLGGGLVALAGAAHRRRRATA